MKIAITHTRYTRIGGSEGYIHALVQRLLDAGHEVHYFCQWWDADADARIRFHRIPNTWKWVRWLKVRSYDRAVTRLVRRADYDVVHGFSKSSEQDVYTDGSGTLEDYQAYSLEAAGSGLARALKRLSPHQREVAAIEARRFTRGNFHKIIAMSKLVARQIQGRYGLRDDEVEVVYNGVDVARFHPGIRSEKGAAFRQQLGIAPDEVAFLLVGNDYRRKGVDTAIEAVTILAHKLGFDRKFRLLVVGKERHAREQELVRKAHEHGVADMVKFHGPSPQIERFFAVADAFVLPTRFDIFGQVVLEAMATGLPAIVSSAAGAAECVVPGETGFVLEDPRDPWKLAEHMRVLAADDAARARMGERARDVAISYSWDRHFRRLLEIYADVARAKRGGSVAAASATPS